MTARIVLLPQRGLLILLAAALLVTGVVWQMTHRSANVRLRLESIVLSDVTIVVPAYREAVPIDINTATPEELDALPGIGPALAARIAAYRAANGPFESVDELVGVDGIGPQTVEGLRAQATASQGVVPQDQ